MRDSARAQKMMISHWIQYLQIQIDKGVENRQFRADLDAKQASYELYGLYLSAHLFYSIYGQEQSHQHFLARCQRLVLIAGNVKQQKFTNKKHDHYVLV